MSKINCQICNAEVNFMELHIKYHEGWTLERYVSEFPNAPIFSDIANRLLQEKVEQWAGNAKASFPIEETFGISSFSGVKTVWGWKRPTADVPEVMQYHFRREILASVLYAMENKGEPILLIGPTGSGKTSIFEQAAARLNRPVTRINLDGDVTRSDLVGQWILNGDNQMQFHHGPLPKAMKEGRILIVDEIDAGAAPVVMVLQAVLEGKPLSLLETSEVIKPHADFRLMATANTNGQGDESGLYAGTQPQNYALFDRFTMVEKVDYAPAKEEMEIVVRQAGITDAGKVITNLVKVANMIRAAHKAGETVCTMSTRNIVNIARKLQVFGDIKRAYLTAYLNKLSGDDLDKCNEMIQRVWD